MAAGEDVIGKRVVQLFHHTNTGGFLLLPWECGKGDTSIFLLCLGLLPPPLETRKSNTFQPKKGKGEK
jgi:hypothetical protein